MNDSNEVNTGQHDPGLQRTLDELTDDIRQSLLDEAGRLSPDGKVSEDDLYKAYKRLQFPAAGASEFADAQTVISQALKENRTFEWVSYEMAVILFVFGLALLSIGAGSDDLATRIGCLSSGSIVEMLILLPFRFAINSRRQNIALRMVGMIIDRVDDPKKLAPLLKDTFLAVVLGKPEFTVAR